MIRDLRGAAAFSILLTLLCTQAIAENISISPPPIPNPEITDGEIRKHRLTYLSVEADTLEMTGYGYDFLLRDGNAEKGRGLNVQVGAFLMDGEIDMGVAGTGEISQSQMNFGFGMEHQLMNKEGITSIFFWGPLYQIMSGKTDLAGDLTYFDGQMYGAQACIQVGLETGDFHLDPFYKISWMQGKMTTDPITGPDIETDIDPFTTTTIGFDILHKPSSITLSSMIQQAAQEEGNGDVEIQIYQVSWFTEF